MATRLCGACQQEKSIRGVWYLTPEEASTSPFVCESCYRRDGVIAPPTMLPAGAFASRPSALTGPLLD